jgi:hypothetical protein
LAGCLLPIASAHAQGAGEAQSIQVDPANPFGAIDTNLWYQAQYLSGYQADAERWRWVRSLSDDQKVEIRARCDRISSDPGRFSEDATLICISVYQVLNRQ